MFFKLWEWESEFRLTRNTRKSDSQSCTRIVLNWEKKLGLGVGSVGPYSLIYMVESPDIVKHLCSVVDRVQIGKATFSLGRLFNQS